MTSIDDLFKGRHFDREIIILGVRWYLRFKLSLRDLVVEFCEVPPPITLASHATSAAQPAKKVNPEMAPERFS